MTRVPMIALAALTVAALSTQAIAEDTGAEPEATTRQGCVVTPPGAEGVTPHELPLSPENDPLSATLGDCDSVLEPPPVGDHELTVTPPPTGDTPVIDPDDLPPQQPAE